MSAPIIQARGITKRFGDFTAVDDLSLTVAAGSIYAFLGANGSGKSTTIRMLIGLLAPTAGEIEVDGVDVLRHRRRVRDPRAPRVTLTAAATDPSRARPARTRRARRPPPARPTRGPDRAR